MRWFVVALLVAGCGTVGHREGYNPSLCEAMGGQVTPGVTEYRSTAWVVTGPSSCLFE